MLCRYYTLYSFIPSPSSSSSWVSLLILLLGSICLSCYGWWSLSPQSSSLFPLLLLLGISGCILTLVWFFPALIPVFILGHHLIWASDPNGHQSSFHFFMSISCVSYFFSLLTSFSFSYSVFSLGCCSRTSSLGSHSQQETCLEYIFSLSSQLVWTSLYVFMSHDFFSSDNFFLLPLNDNLIVISLWWWKRKKKFASGLSMDSGLWMESMSRHHRHSLQSQSSIDTFPVFSFLLKHILT